MDEKKDNDNLFSIKNTLIAIFILMILPLPIACIISLGSWLSFIDGEASVWIGFWGSYLGGIIGTLGVIFVAKLQSEKQIDNLRMVEADNKNRLRIETEINLLKSYQSDINTLENDISLYKVIVSRLLTNLANKDSFETTSFSDFDETDFIEIYQDKIDVLMRKIDYVENNHFSALFNKVELMNIVLKESSHIHLTSLPSGSEFDELDKIIDSLKDGIDIHSFHKNFAYFDLTKIGTDAYMKNNAFEKAHAWLIIEDGEIHKSLSNLLRNLR